MLSSCLVLAFTSAMLSQPPAIRGPFEVKIEDDQAVIVEPLAPVDPQPHAQINSQGNMYINVRLNNQQLHTGVIQTLLNIDDMVLFPGAAPGMLIAQNQPLPMGKVKKARHGFFTTYRLGNVTIKQEVEIVPTRGKPGQRRRLDAAMVRYLIDNADSKPHKVGIRVTLRPIIMEKRAPLFTSPNQPNKVLNGVEIKGEQVPAYLRVLQRADVKEPGFVAHLTCDLGRGFARPDRLVLTGRIAAARQWDIPVIPSKTYSVVGAYWEPKEIPAGGKRSLAYAYGQGIARGADGDGLVQLVLGGSFEPGKVFTVAAYVQDPAAGQHLTLQLPPGVERVEGKERQPVPAVDEAGNCLVLWKARLTGPGRFPLRVHSSTGVTFAKTVSVRRLQ